MSNYLVRPLGGTLVLFKRFHRFGECGYREAGSVGSRQFAPGLSQIPKRVDLFGSDVWEIPLHAWSKKGFSKNSDGESLIAIDADMIERIQLDIARMAVFTSNLSFISTNLCLTVDEEKFPIYVIEDGWTSSNRARIEYFEGERATEEGSAIPSPSDDSMSRIPELVGATTVAGKSFAAISPRELDSEEVIPILGIDDVAPHHSGGRGRLVSRAMVWKVGAEVESRVRRRTTVRWWEILVKARLLVQQGGDFIETHSQLEPNRKEASGPNLFYGPAGLTAEEGEHEGRSDDQPGSDTNLVQVPPKPGKS
ncbi:hypothetical protein Ancab_036454 [Ancistrocladus abbreviatus]